MLPNWIAAIALGIAALIEAVLLGSIITESAFANTPVLWFGLHLIASGVAAVSIASLVQASMPESKRTLLVFCLGVCVALPLLGAIGCLVALSYGVKRANDGQIENEYWQFTHNAELPFTAPLQRQIKRFDSRGFVEQIQYSQNADELYRKVLAVGNIQNNLSVGALKSAVKHSDDRIRLTAYQTLDKKVTDLNREIQLLEGSASIQNVEDQSNTWLQIASNYWELLTLEKDEPIAREQLLKKASSAAVNAIRILPTNRNAHFTFGRIALLQNKVRVATVAFDRSMALGMPYEKAMPYKAEAAFIARDYETVKKSIADIDSAYKVYPPLCHLAKYWS